MFLDIIYNIFSAILNVKIDQTPMCQCSFKFKMYAFWNSIVLSSRVQSREVIESGVPS